MRKQNGFTLTEIVIAMAILSIVAMSIMRIQAFMSVQSIRINERAFATQKVIQMMEELRSLVAGSEKQNINVLDNYNDGASYNNVLTTLKGITAPDNSMSGNVMVGGNWKYLRQVVVRNIGDDQYSRQVYVRVYRSSSANPNAPSDTLAETSSILRTISSDYIPSQSLDVYVIALENIPGWWSSLGTMRPIFSDVIQDMQVRNPGLIINAHWITRSAYGRDKRYTPYINSSSYTDDAPGMPYVYFYPGKVKDDNSNDYIYYDDSIIAGRINVDGVAQNTTSYSMADMYNHAVRYPEEVAAYNAAVAATPPGTPAPEVSLRMLLEEMNTNPTKYMNALMVNLHGELLPLPPMRNYSDAAKDPGDCPYARLVTHAEKLQYPAGGRVRLRVYPYMSKPNAEYYNDTGGVHLSGLPAIRRYDTAVYFDWSSSAPATTINPDGFSVRWTGLIFPRFSETYTFTAYSDDGVNLYINGAVQTVATGPGWTDHAASSTTWNVNLAAGATYSLMLEYYDRTGQAVARLSWSSPTQTLETVPITVLPVATVKVNSFINVTNGNYFDGNLANGEITVSFINGNNIGLNYSSSTVTKLATGVAPTYRVPSWSISNPDATSTLFTFYYTPLVAPSTGTTALTTAIAPFTTITNSLKSGGQATNYYLYDMEYTPCPVTTDFSQDLTSTAKGPKNTARWIIDFAANTISTGTISVETRLGSDITSGTMNNHPENLSTTYVWVGSTAPETEQYQFMGDPRHCPYQDVKAANRYNWYFTQVNNSDYTGFTMSSGGWSSDGNDIDAPRFYQIYRSGLLKTQAIWSAMNGWSYYYYGFGGEFGSDVAPLKSAIKFVKTPWSKTGATGTDYFDEILPYKHTNCNVDANVWAKVVATTDDKWYAKTWLGELYDDSDYSSWKSNGNQPTGAGNYYRANYDTYSAFGRKRTPRAWENGCSSFFNGTSSSGNGPFSHVGDDSGLGAITTVGISMSNDFSFPLLPSISCTRPFKLDKGSGYPLEWYNSVYSSQRTNISIPTAGSKQQNYYSSDNSDYTKASAVVRMSSGTQTCYVVVSGLATQSDFGTGQMGKFTLIGMLEAFFAGGLYSDQDAISQVPRVQITSPKVSDNFTIPPTTSINIAWSTTWKRWDSTKYTQDYLDTYSETTPIVYAVKYSPDGGHTWKYCADDMATTAGSKDLLISAHTTTANSYSWVVSSFAKGSYFVRVECYRRDIGLHYAFDTVAVYLNR